MTVGFSLEAGADNVVVVAEGLAGGAAGGGVCARPRGASAPAKSRIPAAVRYCPCFILINLMLPMLLRFQALSAAEGGLFPKAGNAELRFPRRDILGDRNADQVVGASHLHHGMS